MAQKKLNIPSAFFRHLEEMDGRLKDHPDVKRIYKNCFLDSYERAIIPMEDGTFFSLTGDIPAMWNRDSTQQVMPYLYLADDCSEVRDLIKGIVCQEMRMILRDPYANSFNMEPVGHHYAGIDTPKCCDWTWEQKYETDTLCFPIRLAVLYYEKTGDETVFCKEFKDALPVIIDLFVTEQHHEQRSSYTHSRANAPWNDTLQNDGRGYPTKYTGMVWQGFTPSDDACTLNYNIPGNLFIARILGDILRLNGNLALVDEQYAKKAARMKSEIEHGVELFGTVIHPKYGRIYAYETDGFGNHVLMDDANVPNLLSLPYLGCETNPEIYKNTREFILSPDNPYFFSGTYASGLGSSHTPKGWVWSFGMSMYGMTCNDKDEALKTMDALAKCDAGTGSMHESFNPDNPDSFSREWFAASDSMFAELVQYCAEKKWI